MIECNKEVLNETMCLSKNHLEKALLYYCKKKSYYSVVSNSVIPNF